jgi:hypothetical protein
MPRPKKQRSSVVKISLLASPEQDAILRDAATKAGFGRDRSAWIMAHAIRAAGQQVGTGPDVSLGASIVLDGNIAEIIRKAADAQGIAPIDVVAQWAAVMAAPQPAQPTAAPKSPE